MSSQPSVRKIALMGSTALTRPSAALGAMALMLGSTSVYAIDANTLPTGGTVVGGVSTISQSGARMDVNQSTDRTVIDWRSFDVGGNAHVNFDQPSTSAIAVNRINASTAPSQINGALTANGNVWVLNPNGVMFGASSRVDVSGLVASTGNINVGQFMSGSNRIDFTGGAGGSVINEGQITVSEGGMAAFVAPHVRNNGVIRARLGKVTLAAGETFTLDLAGDKLVEIGLGSSNATAEQLGQVIAEGGIVEISAKAAGGLIDSVVNISGYTSVASATLDGGEIVLGGGSITTTASAVFNADAGDNGDGGSIIAYADDIGYYDGSFSARGGDNGGDGGFVETSGKSVRIADGISVDTSAANGETGNWSIDPDDLVVGVDIAAATIVGSLNTTDVTLLANNSITVNEAIDSSAQANSNILALNDEDTNNDLTINLNADISLGASQILTGQGTTVNVNNDGVDIQDGVDVAASGATVNVAAGTFSENVVIDDTVTLNGAQAGVDARGRSGVAETIVDGSIRLNGGADGVTIDGLTIQDGANTGGGILAGVYLAAGAADATIQNTVFTRTGGFGGYRGILTTSGGSNTGLSALQNSFSGWATGIFLNPTSERANIADNNFDSNFVGMSIDGPEGASVTGNSFTNNGFEGLGLGPGAVGPASAKVANNTFAGNTKHMGVYTDVRVDATTNTFDGTLASDMTTAQLFALEDMIDHGTDGGFSGLITTRANSVFVTQDSGSIQRGIDIASAGDEVNVGNGTYVSSTTLTISKSLTLTGASEAGTIIDQRTVSSNYGISVSANDVSLKDFTLYGPDGSVGSHYGIKVSPGGAPGSRLTNFNIDSVTSRGAGRAELDLNGVNGATITNFTADGRRVADDTETAGAGIQLTDTANVTLTGVTTLGNAWGGVAIYQANRSYDQQTANINIDAAQNTFNEANGLFSQFSADTAVTTEFGTLNLTGFSNIVENADFRADGDEFTFFQETQQAAIDFAMSLASSASSYVEGWTGADVNGIFTVGTSTGGQAMSIGAAVGAAESGNTVNVLAGSYAAGTAVNTENLNINGGGVARVDVLNTETGFTVNGNGTTILGFEIVGPVNDVFTNIDWNDAAFSSSTGITVNATSVSITNNNIHDIRTGVSFVNGSGATATGNVFDNTKGSFVVRSDDIDMSGNSVGATGNEWDIVFLNGVTAAGYGASAPNVDAVQYGADIMALSSGNGGMRVLDRRYGSNGFIAATAGGNRSHIDVNAGSSFTAADDFALGNGLGNLRQPLGFIDDGIDAVVIGGFVNVQDGNYAENAVADKRVNFTFDNVSVDGLTLNAAGTTISGDLSSAVNGFNFNAPVVLSGDTSITTTGTAGLTTGTIDGTAAGGQALTVNAGGAASLGSLGSTTRLGATSIVGGGAKTLTGTTYQADSLNFAGNVFLTQALTTFNTTISNVAAGSITFAGNIFGTTDNAQSIVLAAGNGAPGSSTNGDVSLQNAGAEAVQLGSMIVTADDFSAATVELGGNYASTLTGNQTFTDETLNADGSVTSNVGGNATGPVNAGGQVTVNAGGAINGNINSGSTVNLNGQSVNGNISAPGGGSITGQTVNTNLSGGSYDVAAGSGSITGNPSGLNTSGSGTLNVNGQTVVGSSDADFNQIVVEGYVLPQGAFVTSSGEIVLPQGLSIGLISPAAGEGEGSEPKVVFVRSVQRLGALLSEGYTAIVIDLNDGFDDNEQEIALAQ